MLSVGSNLISQTDALKKVKVDYLYHSLRNPKPFISSKITQLRIVRNLDAKQYAFLKRQLPYVVCAMFNPPYRKTENFAYTEYFILDIDHLYEKGMDLNSVREKIQADKRVVMCFLSPSEDGLKVLFRLKERCYDVGLYSLFYKLFLKEFTTLYGLEQVIDERTSDVCRACFISIDAEAFYRPNADAVNLDSYLKKDDICSLFDTNYKLKKEIKETEKGQTPETKVVDPDNETVRRIKELLGTTKIRPPKAEPFVPQQLDEIMVELKKFVEDTGTLLYEVKNIQYGKKLRFKMGQKLAEINLFYGKHGFSVVQSPKTGTSAELNELMSQLVNSFIWTFCV